MSYGETDRKFNFRNSKGEIADELSVEFLVEKKRKSHEPAEIIEVKTVLAVNGPVDIKIDGKKFTFHIKDGFTWYGLPEHPDSSIITRHKPVEISDALQVRVEIIEATPKRREHPEGKICGECRKFSREKGKEFLGLITHRFANGEHRMHREIIDTIVEGYDSEAISVQNAGFCAPQQSITADVAPACEEFFQQIDKELLERAKS